jgi:hypothetical protein
MHETSKIRKAEARGKEKQHCHLTATAQIPTKQYNPVIAGIQSPTQLILFSISPNLTGLINSRLGSLSIENIRTGPFAIDSSPQGKYGATVVRGGAVTDVLKSGQ